MTCMRLTFNDGLQRSFTFAARLVPYLANRLAANEFAPDELVATLNAMLCTERPGRRGFAADVVAEFDVHAHHEAFVAPILPKVLARQQRQRAQQDALRHKQRR